MTVFQFFHVLREAWVRPGYRDYLWARLRRKVAHPGVADDNARLSLPEKRNLDTPPPRLAERRVMLRDRLFETSPFSDFDPRPHPDDLQGWSSDDPILEDAIRILRPARICEVGSWKGRSAINMARLVKTLALDTEIVCVDTWLGSPEHWLKQEPEWYSSLRIRNGMPQLYNTFLANIIRAGVTDVVTPFPMTSENAAMVFMKLGIKFDIIYIDAAHEYGSVKRDIVAYYDLLQNDGLLIGDDFIVWPEVTRAAKEFAREHRLPLVGKPGKFVIPKGDKYREIRLI
jgi:hypothetical protein